MDKDRKEYIKLYVYAIISVLAFITVSIGATYALLSVTVLGNEENGEFSVKTADVVAFYEAQNEINDIDILPGYSNSLTFTVTNVSEEEDLYGNYTLFWIIDENNINNNDFVYTLTSTSTKDGKTIEESDTNKTVNVSVPVRVPSASSSIGTGIINTGVTHTYTLTIMFYENGESQNSIQGADFKGQLVAQGAPIL